MRRALLPYNYKSSSSSITWPACSSIYRRLLVECIHRQERSPRKVGRRDLASSTSNFYGCICTSLDVNGANRFLAPIVPPSPLWCSKAGPLRDSDEARQHLASIFSRKLTLTSIPYNPIPKSSIHIHQRDSNKGQDHISVIKQQHIINSKSTNKITYI